MRVWTCDAVRVWTCDAVRVWTCDAVRVWTCDAVRVWTCDAVRVWTCDAYCLCCFRLSVFSGNGTSCGAVQGSLYGALILPLAGNVSHTSSLSSDVLWVTTSHGSPDSTALIHSLIGCTISSPQRVNLELMNLRASAAVPYQTLAAAQLPTTLQHYTDVLQDHRSAIHPVGYSLHGFLLVFAVFHSREAAC